MTKAGKQQVVYVLELSIKWLSERHELLGVFSSINAAKARADNPAQHDNVHPSPNANIQYCPHCKAKWEGKKKYFEKYYSDDDVDYRYTIREVEVAE